MEGKMRFTGGTPSKKRGAPPAAATSRTMPLRMER